MAVGPLLVALLLLVSPDLHCSSPPLACPEPCTCQGAPLLNCSSAGLSSVPLHIQDSVSDLDLSQNRLDTVTLHRPYRNLRNVWLENNTITRLSLCIDKNVRTQSIRSRNTRQLGPWSRRRCVSWAPTLQLLSVERNQLIRLPEGLEASASLWVLQLSFNQISTIRPGELRHLRQLKELHLRHNLITHLHPQTFQDLTQLRVLDLSFNMLSSLHPSMYLSLSNIGSDVRLDGNRWQCDCSMRGLRRRMAYDSSRGLQTWSVACAFPSVLAGKDLLQLDEDDLNCFGTENSPERHQDVTVSSGSEILLSCSKQDSSWLTPGDQESLSQPQASLFIGDVSEKDTGLYVCMTADHEVVSVFNLQISRVEHAKRNTRSVPRASPQEIPQERNQRATQSDLTLAVCLSVFITFLIAFILGVLVRPFIDVLWTKITKKKGNPSATNSVSSAEQRQYENEAYSEGDEPEEIITHRERRVTFSSVKVNDDVNVEYYNTVGKSVQAPKTEENEHTPGETGSDHGSRQISSENNQKDPTAISGTSGKRCQNKVQFEHIPDRNELEERSLSSCSDSSQSDGELKKDQIEKTDLTKPNSLQQSEESVQHRADSSTSGIVSPLSTERTTDIAGFSSTPFSDWSPHMVGTKLSDSDLLPGNEEQFDFSDSARSSSLFGSFNYSKSNVLLTSDNQSRDDLSSCSSHLSEGEITEYTLNPDKEAEEDRVNNHNEGEVMEEYYKPSSQEVAGEKERRKKMKPMQLSKWRGVSLGVTSFGKSLDPSPPTAHSSSSSSESEAEITDHKVKHHKGRKIKSADQIMNHEQKQEEITGALLKESHKANCDSDTWCPALDLQNTTRIKRRLDIKAPSPPPDSSSSSDSEDNRAHFPERPGSVDNADLTFQTSGAASHDPDVRWPVLNLQNIPTVKRRLDIKAPSPPPDSSSSSDSEDETIHATESPGMVGNAELPLQRFPTATHDPDVRWPVLDLENIPTIKRRLDIKAPSTPLDSSSSSDSEDETSGHTEKMSPQKVDQSGLLLRDSKRETHDPDLRWPALDLETLPIVNRRLDIKAPSPPDLSSSSDSEDDTAHLAERPGKVDLTQINKRDSDSFSSSDSDDEPMNYIDKSQGQTHMAKLPSKVSQTQWPSLELEHTTHIKRRLDIKSPSSPPDLSSSSDSDDETVHAAERPAMVGNAKFPFQTSGTTSHDPDVRWPTKDLENIPTVKRRLDIKGVRVPSLDSNSSSTSDDEQSADPSFSNCDNGKISSQDGVGITTQEQKMHHVNLDIPYVRRQLDTNAPSPQLDLVLNSTSTDPRQSESNSSTSESEEDRGHRNFKGSAKKNPTSPIPTTDGNIKLEKYTVITDDREDKPSDEIVTPTLEINPELESRWATMNLGISRFRKRLESMPQTNVPPNPPTSPLPDSPLYTGESGTGNTSSRTTLKKNLVKANEEKPDPDRDVSDFKWPLDIKPLAPRESSSSSNSEDETDHSVPRLIPRVPRINRRLNIKAPSPQPDSSSSSSSERDTEGAGYSPEQSLHSSYLSTMTEEEYSKIAYRRAIMKSPMQSNSFSAAGRRQALDNLVAQTGLSHSASPSPRGVSSIQEDGTLDLELSPEIRWTGIGRDQSDHSSASRHLDLGSLSLPAEPELTPPDRGKAFETVMRRYSYLTPSRVSVASSKSLDQLENPSRSKNEIFRALSEDRRETKGLGALKAMSMNRLQWDMEHKDIDV